jgi:integrase
MEEGTNKGGILATGTSHALLSLKEQLVMEDRRFQNPTPKKHGRRWRIRVYREVLNAEGKLERRQVPEDVGPATLPFRVAAKRAQEILNEVNKGTARLNAAVPFAEYVRGTYIPAEMPTFSKSTQGRYLGVLNNYLLPFFGEKTLGEMTVQTIQLYFSTFASSPLAQESREKIWTTLSSVMASSIKYGCLSSNPCHGVKLPPAKRGRSPKPFITEAQFSQLVELIAEPYATMVYVACWSGLRISELIGLRWNDIGADSITIDERYCRGDLSAPKSDASNATIAVTPDVISRIFKLKGMTVKIGGGRGGHQTFKVVKSESPDAFVFQSVRKGAPMRDNNILIRHIKPAGKALGMPWINWRCLRTSFATLCKDRGIPVRDAQALLRHSRASTTLDIYQQTTEAHQRAAVNRLAPRSAMVN